MLAPQLFEISKKEQAARDKKAKELHAKIDKLKKAIEEIQNNKVFVDAFEWRIEFPEVLDENGKFIGFDCVIGNPPYIQLQKMGSDADALQKMNYQTYERTGDIYCLFYEMGMSLLKPGAMLSFITSNKWMRAGYGESLRSFLAFQCDPIQLIDFANNKIFDSATVLVNILSLIKRENQGKTWACSVEDNFDIGKLSDYVMTHAVVSEFNSSESWSILTDIEKSIKAKIEAVGTPLKYWGVSINYGIKTGFNDAFIIDSDKRNQILTDCQTEEERIRTSAIIRPILRGRDIKRYGYDFADQYIIATFPSRQYNIDDYQSLKSYLLGFRMERLEQTGKEYTIDGENVKARKKTNNKWFETQDSINYWDEFSKPKIVWGNLNTMGSYALVPDNMFINAPSCMIVPGNNYLLAALNSKVVDFYIRTLGVVRNGGFFEYKPMFVEKIPVPKITAEQEQLFDDIISSSQTDDERDLRIDEMMNKLYDLSKEEINFLQNQ